MNRTPGMSFNRANTRSRRAENSARMAATQPSDSGDSSAATSAAWLTLEGQLVSWLWTPSIALTTAAGATVHPARQPVMA